MVQRVADLGGLHSYLSRVETPVVSVCVLICLSLSAVSWVEAAVPISQQGISPRLRSLLPSGYWEYIGKPGDTVEVTKLNSSAGGWDRDLLLWLHQQPSDHHRQRAAAPREKRRIGRFTPCIRMQDWRAPAKTQRHSGRPLNIICTDWENQPSFGHSQGSLLGPQASLVADIQIQNTARDFGRPPNLRRRCDIQIGDTYWRRSLQPLRQGTMEPSSKEN